MTTASHDGWLLEWAEDTLRPGYWRAWISNPAREVVGFDSGATPEDAILAACRQWNTARKPLLAALLAATGFQKLQPYAPPKLTKVPFTSLKHGDRILTSFGTVTVIAVKIEGAKAIVETDLQGVVSWHKDNWPLLVTKGGAA